jgi:hypothetical protein
VGGAEGEEYSDALKGLLALDDQNLDGGTHRSAGRAHIILTSAA